MEDVPSRKGDDARKKETQCHHGQKTDFFNLEDVAPSTAQTTDSKVFKFSRNVCYENTIGVIKAIFVLKPIKPMKMWLFRKSRYHSSGKIALMTPKVFPPQLSSIISMV